MAIATCIERLKVDLVVLNHDYTPYSVHCDKMIEKLCKQKDVTFRSFDDLLLHPPEHLLKSKGDPYTIFTPFYRNARKLSVALSRANHHKNYAKKQLGFAKEFSPFKNILPNRHLAQRRGRKEALKILRKLSSFSDYEVERDYPFNDVTIHLSLHLKFTTVSAFNIGAREQQDFLL